MEARNGLQSAQFGDFSEEITDIQVLFREGLVYDK